MTEKYHISPSTGNPNRCYAKKKCPLGASDDEHYSTKSEAREAFERSNANETFSKATKKAVSDPIEVVESTENDWTEPEEVEPSSVEDEVDLDDDFSEIKCDDCGKPLDKCFCDVCEYCSAYEGDEHDEDCPNYKVKPRAYSWDS